MGALRARLIRFEERQRTRMVGAAAAEAGPDPAELVALAEEILAAADRVGATSAEEVAAFIVREYGIDPIELEREAELLAQADEDRRRRASA